MCVCVCVCYHCEKHYLELKELTQQINRMSLIAFWKNLSVAWYQSPEEERLKKKT